MTRAGSEKEREVEGEKGYWGKNDSEVEARLEKK